MEKFIKNTNCQLTILLGLKKSGKSHFLLRMLKKCFEMDIYDEYILILPAYKFEQTDSYSFIKKAKKKENILIYEQYDNFIIENLVNYKRKQKKQSKTCVIIDDASSNSYDENMIYFISVIRHLNCSLYLALHSAKRCLLPFMRSNCDNIMLYRLSNCELLKTVFEEWFSMKYNNFNEFKKEYLDLMSDKKFACMLLYIRDQKIDIQTDTY